MSSRHVAHNRGVTLVEVVLAIAIFAAVIGVTAQSLASFYVTMEVQEQRIESIQAARAVLSAVREKRGEFELEDNQFDWAAFLAWIQGQNNDGWGEFLRTGGDHDELREHALSVACYGADGGAVVPGDNPIEVQVTSQWVDPQGRTQRALIATLLTDR